MVQSVGRLTVNEDGERSSRSGPAILSWVKKMSFILSEIARDTFHHADQNPIDPTHWTTLIGFANLQIASNLCISADLNNDAAAAYTGASFPDDQYAAITLDQLANGILYAICRTNADNTTGYVVSAIGPFGLTTDNLVLFDEADSENVIGTATVTLAPSDIVVCGAIGSTIFVMHNGVVVIQVTNTSTLTGGRPATNVSPFSDVLVDASLSLFTAGSVSQSGGSSSAAPWFVSQSSLDDIPRHRK